MNATNFGARRQWAVCKCFRGQWVASLSDLPAVKQPQSARRAIRTPPAIEMGASDGPLVRHESFNDFGHGITAGWSAELRSHRLWRALFAELLATMLFCAVNIGVIGFTLWELPPTASYGEKVAARTQIALGFGMTITTLVYAFGDTSGANLNPAVSLGLMVQRKMSPLRCACYVIAQLLGAVIGAAWVRGMLGDVFAAHPGVNAINPALASAAGYTVWAALGGEILGTFLLMFCVCCAADVGQANVRTKYVGAMTPLCIGLAVLAAHLLLIPIDGCSINPARSFGPALVAGSWQDHWVFWVGPLLGAAAAAVVYDAVLKEAVDPAALAKTGSGSVFGSGAVPTHEPSQSDAVIPAAPRPAVHTPAAGTGANDVLRHHHQEEMRAGDSATGQQVPISSRRNASSSPA